MNPGFLNYLTGSGVTEEEFAAMEATVRLNTRANYDRTLLGPLPQAVSAGHQGCRRGAGGEENSDSDRTVRISEISSQHATSIFQSFNVISLVARDMNVFPVGEETVPFPWPANQSDAVSMPAARNYLEKLLVANGFDNAYAVKDVHADPHLLCFQSPKLRIDGTSDLAIVPADADDGDLGCQLCVLFQLKTNDELTNATKLSIVTKASVELVACRAISCQRNVLLVVTNLADISCGIRFEWDDAVRAMVKRRYNFISVGQMAAFVVAHVRDCCSPRGYVLLDSRPEDANSLSLKRKFNPEGGDLMNEIEDIREEPDAKYRMLRTRDVLRSHLGVELSDLSVGSFWMQMHESCVQGDGSQEKADNDA